MKQLPSRSRSRCTASAPIFGGGGKTFGIGVIPGGSAPTASDP